MIPDIIKNLELMQAMYEYKLSMEVYTDEQVAQIKSTVKSIQEQIEFLLTLKGQLI